MRWMAGAVILGLLSTSAWANTHIALNRVPVVQDVRQPGFTTFLAIESHATLMTPEAFTLIMSPRFLRGLLRGEFEPYPDRRTTAPKVMPVDATPGPAGYGHPDPRERRIPD